MYLEYPAWGNLTNLNSRNPLTNTQNPTGNTTQNNPQAYQNLRGNNNSNVYLTQELQEAQNYIQELQIRLHNQKQTNEQELQNKENRIDYLNGLLDQYQEREERARLEALQSKVLATLGDYRSRELSIYALDDKVYVSFVDGFLFQNNYRTLSQEGLVALEKLSELIKDEELNIIMVENDIDKLQNNRVNAQKVAEALLSNYTEAKVMFSNHGNPNQENNVKSTLLTLQVKG